MRVLDFPSIPCSTRDLIAFEGMAPRGDYLLLTCFSRKNHPTITPFGYCLLPLHPLHLRESFLVTRRRVVSVTVTRKEE
jgi:hypothetical protein